LHPAQLYECLATLMIFGVLLWWFPRKKRDGDVFLAYLGLYAGARFLLEFVRGDEDRGFVFNHLLSTSQFIALLLLAGIAAVFVWRRGHRGEELGPVPVTSDKRPALETSKAKTKGGFAAGKARPPASGRIPKRAKR
jgi:prolipoprotein diacylglyceryltransferase